MNYLEEIDKKVKEVLDLTRLNVLYMAQGLTLTDTQQLNIADLDWADLYYKVQNFFINLKYNKSIDIMKLTDQEKDLIIKNLDEAIRIRLLNIFEDEKVITIFQNMFDNSEKQYEHEMCNNERLYEKNKEIFTPKKGE